MDRRRFLRGSGALAGLGAMGVSGCGRGINVVSVPTVPLPLPSDILTRYATNFVQVFGQSELADGYFSDVVSTVQPYDNLTFNGGPRAGGGIGAPLRPDRYSSSIPCVELVDGPLGETVCSGFGNRVTHDLRLRGINHTLFLASSARGGTSYEEMAPPDQQVYLNARVQVNAARVLTASRGSFGVQARICTLGNTDDTRDTPGFSDDLVRWQAASQADDLVATGQTTPVPFVLVQVSGWGYACNIFNGGSGRTTPLIALAQLQASSDYPKLFTLACPQYPYPHQADGIHLGGDMTRLIGEICGRAYVNIKQGLPWRFAPKSWSISGQTITVHFETINGASLVFDTVAVREPANVAGSFYGFEFADGSGKPPRFASRPVILPDGKSIGFTLAAPPQRTSGLYLRYAYTVVSGAATGPEAGARGNLRDDDATDSIFGYGKLYNWCPHFSVQLA